MQNSLTQDIDLIKQAALTQERIEEQIEILYLNTIKALAIKHIPRISDEAVKDLAEELGVIVKLEFKCSFLKEYISTVEKEISIVNVEQIMMGHFEKILAKA